jgi:putative peptidoglycan lipid II flippase
MRLALSCAAMIAVLLLGRWLWPDWSTTTWWTRVWHLGALVAAGGGAYVATLFATGFRMRDLRGV